MRVIQYIFINLNMLLLLASCEKEEKAIVLPPGSDSVMHISATMGDQYKTQVFVNIETGETWPIDNESWDLQFESSDEGSMIWMNGGKRVLIGNTGNKTIKNLVGQKIKMRWDDASGKRDSSVLGAWCDPTSRVGRDSVYLIDCGDGCRPEEKFYQFQIKSVTDYKYVIRVARIDGSQVKEIEIPKDEKKQHVYFSFRHGGEVMNFEPDKQDWHFCFVRYRWIYYEFNPPLLYGVCGIHINTDKIEVAIDSTLNFETVRISDIMGMKFSKQRDVMGFDWKTPDFFSPTGVKYNCRKYVNYFIRDHGRGYKMRKLRFIGFYDKNGIKGSPQFEVENMH